MKKQYSKVIKIVIQILFFLWIPESFAASLYAVKKLIHAVSVNTTKTITSGIFPAIVTVHSREFDSCIYQKVR